MNKIQYVIASLNLRRSNTPEAIAMHKAESLYVKAFKDANLKPNAKNKNNLIDNTVSQYNNNGGEQNGTTEPAAEYDTGRNSSDVIASGGKEVDRVLSVTRLDGRGDRGSNPRLLTEEHRQSLNDAGVTDFGISVTEDHKAFSAALDTMRSENMDGGSVDPKSVEELDGSITFMNADGTAGGAVQPNGNIVAVFKNKHRNQNPKAAIDIVMHAISNGGDRLDCYGSFLANEYAKCGMLPVARVKYARGFNIEMDAYIDDMRSKGKRGFETDPDIYFMRLADGATINGIVTDYIDYIDNAYHMYSQEELDSLPLFEDKGDAYGYDLAEKYRDDLIDGDTKKSDLASVLSEYHSNPNDGAAEQTLRDFVQGAPIQELLDSPELQEAKSRAFFEPEQETINDNSPQRKEKREAWGNQLSAMGSYSGKTVVDGKKVDTYNGDVRNEHIAFIVIGQSAAGKSTIANPISQKYAARIYDSDFVKEMIDEFDGGYGAGRVHKESSVITEREYKRAVEGGVNVVLPIVGGRYAKVKGIADSMRKSGYTVYLVLNELDSEKAAKRAVTRFFTTGRLVDPRYVLGQGNAPRDTYQQALKEGIANGYQWFNNDVKYGEQPRLVHQEYNVGTIVRGLDANDGGNGRSDDAISGRVEGGARSGESAAEVTSPQPQRTAWDDLRPQPIDGDADYSFVGSNNAMWDSLKTQYGSKDALQETEQKPPRPTQRRTNIADNSLQQSMDVARRFGRAAYKGIISGAHGTEKVARVQSKIAQGAVNVNDLSQGIRVAPGIAQYVMNDAAIDIDGNEIGRSFNPIRTLAPTETA